MIYQQLFSPAQVASQIAKSAKEKRLSLNLSQKSLSERSAVSLGVIKKFESTGKISLESLLKLALALDSLNDFSELFKKSKNYEKLSLDQLLEEKTRKRGRK